MYSLILLLALKIFEDIYKIGISVVLFDIFSNIFQHSYFSIITFSKNHDTIYNLNHVSSIITVFIFSVYFILL